MQYVRLIIACAPLALGGCVAKTAFDVVTAPVRVAGKAVDLATTSQSEADEKRGRALRQREEEIGRLQRRYEDQLDDCNDGKQRACSEAQTTYGELQTLLRDAPDR
ncbi:MAG: hypothetical protein B7X57_00800 [Erythrobacter sp. 34-65-8]|nr:MAG: hypothetical protein B7X57_00800 [Erythrobacter sp. 34-65-8]